MTYVPRTAPLAHQKIEFDLHGRERARGLLWDMGTGKTKSIIDQSAALALDGEINGLLVIAPNGVHRNWVVAELPKHLPESLLDRYSGHWYSQDAHASKEHVRSLNRLISAPSNHLSVLTSSYNSMMTDHGRDAIKKFLSSRKCMYVLDESRRIKNPAAKRTIRILSSQRYGKYLRILNGTPVSQGPFDIYPQVKFIDPEFWDKRGISSFAGFKNTFGIFGSITVAGGRTIEVVRGYKNLPLLKGWLSEICTRVTKEQVLDLPPRNFRTISFEMTPRQKRLYGQMKNDFMIELAAGDCTAELALTRMLRLQQITCGYVPLVDNITSQSKMEDIDSVNPRLELLLEIAEDLPHKAIIWCRFKRDIDLIMAGLEKQGQKAVRYDGSVNEQDRGIAIDRFQKEGGDAQFFVANAAAAGEGLTLHAARTVIRYSNSFDLAERNQSDDRAYRFGQKFSVDYIDLVASGTVDEKITASLRNKFDIAREITGDKARSWLV